MRAFMPFGTLGASSTTFKPGFARSATLVTAVSFFGAIKRILLRAQVRDGRRKSLTLSLTAPREQRTETVSKKKKTLTAVRALYNNGADERI
jgi:hypothetical protein